MDWLNPWKEEKSDVWWRQNSPPSNHHQDDAEVLDLVMPMYNLIEHSSNYSKTTGSLWFCSKDEATSFNADIDNFKWDYDNLRSFKYKVKLLENTEVDGGHGILRNATIAYSLKYLSDFWRSIQTPLIYCKVESKLRWTKYFVFSAAFADNVNAYFNNIILNITDTKLYASFVTLSAKDNEKISKLLRKGFERSV